MFRASLTMSSEGGGKIKQKREHASNKPYTRKSSFLRKMKDLLMPSYFSKGVLEHVSDTEASSKESTEQQVPKNEVKRGNNVTKTQNSSNFSNNSFTELRGETTESTLKPSIKEDTDKLITSIPTKAINDYENTQSVQSIIISPRDRRRESTSDDSKRRRVWSPESVRQGKPFMTPTAAKPAFNSVLFSTSKNNSIFGESFGESSFYEGKTRFGGAAASERKGKTSLNKSLPYQRSLPLRKQVKAHPLNNTFSATTSATAQRILDTLDRISTPLGDAKRIPQADSLNDSILSFTPSSYRRSSIIGNTRPITRPLQIPNRGPPTSQVLNSSYATIAANRSKSIATDRNISFNTSSGLHVSEESVSVENIKNNCQSTGLNLQSGQRKIKTKKFSQHIASSTNNDDNEVVIVPDLRTDYTLPITNMAPIPVPLSIPSSHVPPSSYQTFPSSVQFTFSTPIEQVPGFHGASKFNSNNQGFQFSSPIQAKANAAGAEDGSKLSPEPAVGASSGVSFSSAVAVSTPSTQKWGPSFMAKPKTSPDIGGTSSSFTSYNKWNSSSKKLSSPGDSNSSSCFVQPASSLKTGSVMDILGKSSSLPVTSTIATVTSKPSISVSGTDDLMAKFKRAPGSWDCDACMLRNEATSVKCVACETPKPGASIAASNTNTNKSDDLMAKFKKPAGSWDCNVCMINNKSDKDKCAACETPKPGGNSAKAESNNNHSLSEMFKKPTGSWECDTCMVQNSSAALRCIACDSPKPGLQSAGIVSKSITSEPSSSISIKPGGGFTFGKNVGASTADSTHNFTFGSSQPTTNKSPSTDSKTSQLPTGFSFAEKTNSVSSLSKEKDVSKTESTTELSNTALTNDISVGLSKPVTSTVCSGFIFGASKDKANTGGFQFGAKTNSQESKSGFSFGSKPNSSVDAPITSGFSFGAKPTLENSTPTSGFSLGTKNNTNKLTPTEASSLTTNTSVDSPVATVGFSFGAKTNSESLSTTTGFGFGVKSNNAVSSFSSETNKSDSVSSGFSFGAPKTDSNVSVKSVAFGDTKINSIQSSVAAFASTKTENNTQTNFMVNVSVSNKTSPSVPAASTFSVPTTKTQAGLFAFGAPVSNAKSNTPLGVGSSSIPPVVNGLAAPSQTTNVFGSGNMGQTFNSSVSPKRRIDETDAPVAKKVFGSSGTSDKNETLTNGLFKFGENGSTSNSVFGGAPATKTNFAFGSTQSIPKVPSGFNFAATGNTNSTSGTLNFSAKPVNSTPLFGATAPVVANGAAPNFNFSAATGGSVTSTPFQFGGPGTNNSQQNLFTFSAGAPSPIVPPGNSAPQTGSGFGAFNIGTGGNPERRKKVAARRLKKP